MNWRDALWSPAATTGRTGGWCMWRSPRRAEIFCRSTWLSISAELARRLAVLSEKDQQRLAASIGTLDEIMDMMLYSHTVG